MEAKTRSIFLLHPRNITASIDITLGSNVGKKIFQADGLNKQAVIDMLIIDKTNKHENTHTNRNIDKKKNPSY